MADLDNWRRRGPRGEGVARLGEVHDVNTGADTRAEGGRGPGEHPVRPRRPRPSTAAGPAQAPQSARSPLNPRERTSNRRSRGLPDDLGGQVTISRVTRRSLGPPRRSPAAPHHRPLNNLPDPGLCGRFGQSAGADWLFMHQDMGDGSAGPGSDTRGRLFGRRLSTLSFSHREGSRGGVGARLYDDHDQRGSAPNRLLRPFSTTTPLHPLLYEKKGRSRGWRSVVEGGGA